MGKINLEEAINSRPSYKELLKECIKEEEGEIVVNWGKIRNEDLKTKGGIADTAFFVLHDVGVLSAEYRGNYLITGAGVSINPSFLYFTTEKDAIDYKKAFFDNVRRSASCSRSG